MRVGSLCTGYGGIEMGLRAAGVEVDVRWLAEIEPTLALLHGETPNLGDIRTIDWSAVEPVDMLTAGFPCQPTSAAGRQLGDADPRWLWPDVRAAVAELAPTHVLIENVRNLVSYDKGRLWAAILVNLADLGYSVRWLTLGACHVGAAHHRHRVFALAVMGGDSIERIDTPACGGARRRTMLPTPNATDTNGPKRVPEQRTHRGLDHGPRLCDVATLLPTPAARDGDGRGEGAARYWSARAQHRTNGLPLGAVVALQTGYWGRFAAAVERHVAIYGPHPMPTEPNRNGAPRLTAAFAEWLMCLPAGHVTSKLDRVPALRAIGNGVCPPQLAAAWGLLT